MPDTVTMTWTDTTGTYTSSFTITNPTLAEVKEAYSANKMQAFPEPEGGVKATDDEVFYAEMSQNLVHQVVSYAQNYKHQKAVQAVPPIAIAPVEPPVRR